MIYSYTIGTREFVARESLRSLRRNRLKNLEHNIQVNRDRLGNNEMISKPKCFKYYVSVFRDIPTMKITHLITIKTRPEYQMMLTLSLRMRIHRNIIILLFRCRRSRSRCEYRERFSDGNNNIRQRKIFPRVYYTLPRASVIGPRTRTILWRRWWRRCTLCLLHRRRGDEVEGPRTGGGSEWRTANINKTIVVRRASMCVRALAYASRVRACARQCSSRGGRSERAASLNG